MVFDPSIKFVVVIKSPWSLEAKANMRSKRIVVTAYRLLLSLSNLYWNKLKFLNILEK